MNHSIFSNCFNLDQITQDSIKSIHITPTQVQATLQKSRWTLADLPTLISPAAQNFLEDMAQHAHRITVQRFGKTMQIFVPMYLANVCYNSCSYCGFSIENDYKRITLTPEEILKEGLHLKNKGFQRR